MDYKNLKQEEKQMIFYHDIEKDDLEKIRQTYVRHGCQHTYQHVCQVAEVAIELAKKYELNIEKCIIASLLHDISVMMTQDQMYAFAKKHNWTIDLSEEKYHFLLHQRLSRVIAQKEFCILDEDILSAIECHTTLKKNASDYDKVVFIADKIAWDQKSKPLYDELIDNALDDSLDYAYYQFIKYQFDHHGLLMPHHWLKEAYQELKEKYV